MLPGGKPWPTDVDGMWLRIKFIDSPDGRASLAAARAAHLLHGTDAPDSWRRLAELPLDLR